MATTPIEIPITGQRELAWAKRVVDAAADPEGGLSPLARGNQGQGVGAVNRLFTKAVPEYMRLGMKRIDLHANLEVGGYAWLRYGFKPDGPIWGVEGNLDALEKLKEQVSDQARQELTDFVAQVKQHWQDDAWLELVMTSNTPALNGEIARLMGEKIDSPMKALLLVLRQA